MVPLTSVRAGELVSQLLVFLVKAFLSIRRVSLFSESVVTINPEVEYT